MVDPPDGWRMQLRRYRQPYGGSRETSAGGARFLWSAYADKTTNKKGTA